MTFNAQNVGPAVAKKVISYDGPSAQEVLHEATLNAWCASRREPEEEYQRRLSVLSRLDNIVKLWVRSVMVTEFRMTPEAAAKDVQPRLYTTGSFRYNVHSSGSDIDAVLIAPNRVTRQHFFTSLVDRFRAESSWITSIDLVTDAIVPIITLKCDGIDIDLSFGSIKLSKVPEVITDDLLRGLDEQSVRSCNAVRVAHSVIQLVPNTGAFRQALRFIKAWGKYRGIYSSKFGFPSGIGWALLVAKWFKPDPHLTGQPNNAIYLTESLTPASYVGPCWDPRAHTKDAQALFPVITPANPYSNSCYNVTLTTLRIMCLEFQRGHELLSQRLQGPVPEGPYGVWEEVLEPYPFFSAHKHYLHVQVQAAPDHYQRFVDAVEAKIRFLWSEHPMHRGKALECFPNVKVHVFSARFEQPSEVAKRQAKGKAAADDSASQSELHTAHFLFGLDTAPQAQSSTSGQQPQQQKMDLAGIVVAFRAIVGEIKEYQPPATRLPTVTIVEQSKVPEWIIVASGGSSTAQRKRPRDEEEIGNASSATTSVQAVRTITEQRLQAPVPAAEVTAVIPQAGDAVPKRCPAAVPARTSHIEAAGIVDAALGMDF